MHKGTMRRVKLLRAGGRDDVSGAAMAADLSRPVYKAPPAGALPVTYDWTGFYVGGHIGYGWADKSWQDLVGFGTVSHKADGFLGGGQAGFNYQIGMFVLGVEGDVSWADMKGGSNLGPVIGAPLGATFNIERRLDIDPDRPPRPRVRSLAGLRQGRRRLGARKVQHQFLQLPGSVDLTETPMDGPSAPASNTPSRRTGRQARVQLHGLRHRKVPFTPFSATEIDQQIHAIKFGINYKFGGGPIMARY